MSRPRPAGPGLAGQADEHELARRGRLPARHLVQVIRHGLKKIQYLPGLIEGCLAGTGLALEPGETRVDIVN
jgi:hypothetical protein